MTDSIQKTISKQFNDPKTCAEVTEVFETVHYVQKSYKNAKGKERTDWSGTQFTVWTKDGHERTISLGLTSLENADEVNRAILAARKLYAAYSLEDGRRLLDGRRIQLRSYEFFKGGNNFAILMYSSKHGEFANVVTPNKYNDTPKTRLRFLNSAKSLSLYCLQLGEIDRKRSSVTGRLLRNIALWIGKGPGIADQASNILRDRFKVRMYNLQNTLETMAKAADVAKKSEDPAAVERLWKANTRRRAMNVQPFAAADLDCRTGDVEQNLAERRRQRKVWQGQLAGIDESSNAAAKQQLQDKIKHSKRIESVLEMELTLRRWDRLEEGPLFEYRRAYNPHRGTGDIVHALAKLNATMADHFNGPAYPVLEQMRNVYLYRIRENEPAGERDFFRPMEDAMQTWIDDPDGANFDALSAAVRTAAPWHLSITTHKWAKSAPHIDYLSPHWIAQQVEGATRKDATANTDATRVRTHLPGPDADSLEDRLAQAERELAQNLREHGNYQGSPAHTRLHREISVLMRRIEIEKKANSHFAVLRGEILTAASQPGLSAEKHRFALRIEELTARADALYAKAPEAPPRPRQMVDNVVRTQIGREWQNANTQADYEFAEGRQVLSRINDMFDEIEAQIESL